MTDTDRLIQTGNWGEGITWELYETTTLPPKELCTAVMCVAVADNKIVLACSERGWGMLGGHIEDGESLDDALAREALEEGGFVLDEYQLFAVRKITSEMRVPHPRPGKEYPFPTGYMTYYWATTTQPLAKPTGEEIIESGSFAIDDIHTLHTHDQFPIEVGWQAFLTRAML
jgi:8-oxo-dGTP pyrophosphatase MutT (NUDIX family)